MREIKVAKSKKSALIRIALVLFCLYAVVMWIHVQLEISEKESQITETESQIEAQKLTNEKMKNALENEDPDYIEQAIRNELDYAKPGEKVFIDISGE